MKEALIQSYEIAASSADRWYYRNTYYHRQLEILAHFIIPLDISLAEIGCGTGNLLAAIPAKDRLGIDISPEMVRVARTKYPDIEFIHDDVENLKTRRIFNYVLLSELIGSLVDIQTALEETKRLIEVNGRLVIFSHNYLWQPLLILAEWLGLKAKPPLQSWITSGDLENLLYLAGYEVIRSGKRVLCPIYIPLISWFCNRVLIHVPLISRLGLVQFFVARPLPLKKNDVSVSIIVPARNEKGNIENIVQRIPDFPAYSEIVFVEGHSKDGTWEEIQRVVAQYKGKKNIVFTQQSGRGKGDAVRKGFEIAEGELLMILDADLTVSAEDLPKFYEAIIRGRGDFINGSRLVYPMEKQAMRFLNILGNKFFAAAFSWLLSQRIKDTLCGTKVLLKSDYLRIAENRAYFGDFDPFGDFDLLFGAAKLNLKIIDLPIRYRDRVYGTTQIQRFRHGWLLMKMCFFAAQKFKI